MKHNENNEKFTKTFVNPQEEFWPKGSYPKETPFKIPNQHLKGFRLQIVGCPGLILFNESIFYFCPVFSSFGVA